MQTPAQLAAWYDDPQRRCVVVGVLNATPDSFSDGGRYLEPTAARARVAAMLDEGADWIDVGGESTRPGSKPVPAHEQIRRVLPAVEAGAEAGVVVSIDTASAAVAKAALAAGALVVNDVTAGRGDAAMLDLMASAEAAILMHMRGTPATMQADPQYDDVVVEVADFLEERADAARAAGVRRVLIDPGLGFGKTTQHNLALLAATRRFADHRPTLVGASRKRFLGADRRQFGTAAAVAIAMQGGAAAVRVHDVRAMRQVVDVVEATLSAAERRDQSLRPEAVGVRRL